MATGIQFIGKLFLLFIAIGASLSRDGDGYVRMCYYTRTKHLTPSQIVPSLCTHLTYAFAHISNDTLVPQSPADLDTYRQIIGLKKSSPTLIVLLSIQNGFPSVVDGPASRVNDFAENATKFLRKYGFDGIDFDWEFPQKTEKDKYALFLKIVRQVIQKEAVHSKKRQLLMSAALPAVKYVLDTSYDLPTVSALLDLIGIMTYDFHRYIPNVDNTTGYNSPLVTPKGENPMYSTSSIMEYVLKKGVPPSKLMLGIPAYGRTYTLKSSVSHGLHAPAVGKGIPGPVIGATGVYIYSESCMLINDGGTRVWDSLSMVPYIYNETQWVSYGDTQSATEKCQWVRNKKLRGVMIWAIQLDDVTGICDPKKQKYTLLRTIASRLP